MYLLKEFYGKLPDDKIKINWNKNPIKMDTFLEFLTIPVVRSKEHLGSCTGWTKLVNKEQDLIIGGGVVNGVEYLDSIKFGRRLANPYNNFVNPFYLWEILTKEGLDFFYKYYDDEISKRIIDLSEKIETIEIKLSALTEFYNKIKASKEFKR